MVGTATATPGRPKTAVILSGGGANGAYEVGVLKALVSGKSPVTGYQCSEPDIFVGTSVGAFNCAFLVSQWEGYGPTAVANLERFWLDRLAGSWQDNGVFRFRVNPFSILRPTGLMGDPLGRVIELLEDSRFLFFDALERAVDFAADKGDSLEQRVVELLDLSSFLSTEPLERILRMIDFEAIRRSPRWLKVAATNWTTGKLRIFWNHDMTDTFGPVALRASAAIPGFFEPVEDGSQLLSDGSVLLNTPLSPAIHAGAEVLHVVYLDPAIEKIPLPQVPNTFDTLLRTQQIQWASSYCDDIADAERINCALGAIERLDRGEPLDCDEAVHLSAEGFGAVRDRFRPLTIHRYRPTQAFEGGLGLLNFSRERIEELIDRGFQDAVNHDCRASGDVFPVGTEPPPGPRPGAFEAAAPASALEESLRA